MLAEVVMKEDNLCSLKEYLLAHKAIWDPHLVAAAVARDRDDSVDLIKFFAENMPVSPCYLLYTDKERKIKNAKLLEYLHTVIVFPMRDFLVLNK